MTLELSQLIAGGAYTLIVFFVGLGVGYFLKIRKGE